MPLILSIKVISTLLANSFVNFQHLATDTIPNYRPYIYWTLLISSYIKENALLIISLIFFFWALHNQTWLKVSLFLLQRTQIQFLYFSYIDFLHCSMVGISSINLCIYFLLHFVVQNDVTNACSLSFKYSKVTLQSTFVSNFY